MRLSLNLIVFYGQLSAPFIPDAADAMRAAMGLPDLQWPRSAITALARCKAGDTFTVPENLFAKITDEQREEWSARFSGIKS